jgi:hypothetical protein
LGSIAAASSGRRDLDQAQVGPIGILAHELGIDRDEVVGGHSGDEGGEIGLGDQRVNFHVGGAIAALARLDKGSGEGRSGRAKAVTPAEAGVPFSTQEKVASPG